MDQVHLPQIRLAGIFCNSAAVFNGYAAMRIAFDALSSYQHNCRTWCFAEAMPVSRRYR